LASINEVSIVTRTRARRAKARIVASCSSCGRANWNRHYRIKKRLDGPMKVHSFGRPGLPATTVDLGENNLAVAAAWKGRRIAGTLFLRGAAHERRRMRRWAAIRQRQMASGKPTKGVRSNRRRWVRLTQAEVDTARQIARRIVDFAKAHGSRVIVFEALNRMPTTRGMGWTRRQNLRRSWWMRGRILAHTRAMALWEGILVVRRDPAFTSKACPRCGAYGERFSWRANGGGPATPSGARCADGKETRISWAH